MAGLQVPSGNHPAQSRPCERCRQIAVEARFEHAALGLAQCQRQGNITAPNPALEPMVGGKLMAMRSLHLADLIHPGITLREDHAKSERLLREWFKGERDGLQDRIEAIPGEWPASEMDCVAGSGNERQPGRLRWLRPRTVRAEGFTPQALLTYYFHFARDSGGIPS